VARFDRYVVVDWSASATPKTGADSIWIADTIADPTDSPTLHNPATRLEAERLLDAIIESASEARTLLAVDASLGYPAGTAALFGFVGRPWDSMWRAVAERSVDDARNANNRFEVASTLNALAGSGSGPFWGVPAGRADPHLGPTKVRSVGVAEFRTCERSLRADGLSPASCWQLLGVGSVGSQTLTLLPVLRRLLDRHDRVGVWPFTTGLRAPSPTLGDVVIAEVWPTAFAPEIPIGMIRDAAQVIGVAQALRDADASREIDPWFTPEVAPSDREAVENEEGWMLGPRRSAR
jgi:precorrin-8X/cobalt-precorrin-8 methylmutase